MVRVDVAACSRRGHRAYARVLAVEIDAAMVVAAVLYRCRLDAHAGRFDARRAAAKLDHGQRAGRRDGDRWAAVSLFRRHGVPGVAGASGAGRGGLRGGTALWDSSGHHADHVWHFAAGGRGRTAGGAISGRRRRAVPGERLRGQLRAGRGPVSRGRLGVHRRDGSRLFARGNALARAPAAAADRVSPSRRRSPGRAAARARRGRRAAAGDERWNVSDQRPAGALGRLFAGGGKL